MTSSTIDLHSANTRPQHPDRARPHATETEAAPSIPVQRAVPLGPDATPLFDPLLTVDQVAAWIGKPKATLYAWRTRKLGPRGIRVGCDLRYRRSEIEAWLDAMTEQRPS